MRDTGAHIELHTLQMRASSTSRRFHTSQFTRHSHSIETEARKAFDLNTGRRQKTEPESTTTIPTVSATAGLLIGKGGSTCRGIKQK